MVWQFISWFWIFGVSLWVLLKAANAFTATAEHVGLYWRLPPFIVGVTIVSLGTTVPELASSIVATLQGASEIVAGNVVGSNIANIALVLGLAALVAPSFRTSWRLIRAELPLLGGAAIISAPMMMDGIITMPEAALSLGAYFMYVLITLALRQQHIRHFTLPVLEQKLIIDWPKTITILLVTPLFIFLSAKFTVDALINIANILGLGAGIIGATLLATGTSLPELTIAIQAARKGKPALVAGNVLGANIMNLLFIVGISGLISPIKVPQAVIVVGLPFLLIATAMYFVVNRDRHISRSEGLLLIGIYLAFVVLMFVVDGG